MYSPDSSTNTTWSRDVIDFWNPTGPKGLHENVDEATYPSSRVGGDGDRRRDSRRVLV